MLTQKLEATVASGLRTFGMIGTPLLTIEAMSRPHVDK